MARAEAFPADKLAYFDRERGEDLLLEMRYLPIYARPATAEYIVDNNLDAPVRPPLFRGVVCVVLGACCWPVVCSRGCGRASCSMVHGWAQGRAVRACM